MSSAGGKASRKDYADVLEVRASMVLENITCRVHA